MQDSRSLLALVCLATCGFLCTFSSAQAGPASAASGPRLQAELIRTIDASRAKAGDEVIARTITALEIGGKKFAPGATVRGHVVAAEPDRLLLVFDQISDKKNAAVPLGLSLRAVMMPHAGAPASNSGGPVSPRAEAAGGNTGVDQGPVNRGDMLRSPEAMAQDSANTVFNGSSPPVSPKVVETINGGVIGLPNVHLQASPDPKAGATFQSDKDRKLKLEKGLQLMFVVSQPM